MINSFLNIKDRGRGEGGRKGRKKKKKGREGEKEREGVGEPRHLCAGQFNSINSKYQPDSVLLIVSRELSIFCSIGMDPKFSKEMMHEKYFA